MYSFNCCSSLYLLVVKETVLREIPLQPSNSAVIKKKKKPLVFQGKRAETNILDTVGFHLQNTEGLQVK